MGYIGLDPNKDDDQIRLVSGIAVEDNPVQGKPVGLVEGKRVEEGKIVSSSLPPPPYPPPPPPPPPKNHLKNQNNLFHHQNH